MVCLGEWEQIEVLKMQLLPVFNDSYEETNHIRTARFYLENLLQINEFKLGGHTYKKYFYRDGVIILKT